MTNVGRSFKDCSERKTTASFRNVRTPQSDVFRAFRLDKSEEKKRSGRFKLRRHNCRNQSVPHTEIWRETIYMTVEKKKTSGRLFCELVVTYQELVGLASLHQFANQHARVVEMHVLVDESVHKEKTVFPATAKQQQ